MSNGKRRLARVAVSADLIGKLAAGRFEVVSGGVPEDARLVFVFTDHEAQTMSAVFEHESFAEVADGAAIPYAPQPQIRRLE